MPNKRDEQREVLASIDAILTMIEKYPSLGFDFEGLLDNVSVTLNPFEFLLAIIRKGVSDTEMIDWLVGILTKGLPVIELGVKGILLSNLKKTIDCNNDPRIPQWLRQNPFDNRTTNKPTNSNQDRGFIFNLRNIDYKNMLSESPVSPIGQMNYFGTKTYWYFTKGEYVNKNFYSHSDAVRAWMKSKEQHDKDNTPMSFSLGDLTKRSEINNINELARAKDFNAFLWFVANKAYFTNSTEIVGDVKDYEYFYQKGDKAEIFKGSKSDTILGVVNGQFSATIDDVSPFTMGDTIVQRFGQNKPYYMPFLSLCIKGKQNITLNNKTETYEFVPVSSNYKSCNWYVNSGTYFNFLKSPENRVERDYEKDEAICNIESLNMQDVATSNVSLMSPDNYVRFTILPAPFIHMPHVNIEKQVIKGVDDSGAHTKDVTKVKYTGEPPWRFQRILFDKNGIPNKKSNYTVLPDWENKIQDKDKHQTRYQLFNSVSGTIIQGVELTVSWDDGSYELISKDPLLKKFALVECYKGMTVYDFNYNFVMGMQLFDPAVVASQLIEMATNILAPASLSVNAGINKTESAYQMRVAETVKKIVEATAFEASDCFFTFSNKEIEEIEHKAELKRAQGYEFIDDNHKTLQVSLDEAYSILNGFDDNATLQENKDVITRAITQATTSITNEVLPEDRYSLHLNLIQELIKGLTLTIVLSLLTPKIILLFEVNRRLMNKDIDEPLSLEEFLESISGLITAIVSEIRDLILRELLAWATQIIESLIAKLASLLVLEQTEYYIRLIRGLLKACSFKIKHRKLLESQLDVVDYADIDNIDRPVTQDC